MKSAKLQIQEFAERTGVTVRALHHYDRLGLLKPSGRTPSGYRLYGERELVRLQQILTLKFIGCSLPQIKALLTGSPHVESLASALDLQHEALVRRRRELDIALTAVEKARQTLSSEGRADWDALRQIVEVIEMEQSVEWMKKYYTPEQIAEFDRRRQAEPGAIEQGQTAWRQLLAEIEDAVKEGVDPASARGRELAERWIALVNDFTGGDAGVMQSLNNLYADQKNWPSTFKRPWSDEAQNFYQAAKAAHGLGCK